MDLKQVGKHNAQHTCDQYPQERTRHGGGAPPLEAVDQGDDQQGEGQSNRQADQDGVPALEVEGHQNLPQHQHRQHEGDDGPHAGTPGEEDQEHGEDGGQQSLLADAVVVGHGDGENLVPLAADHHHGLVTGGEQLVLLQGAVEHVDAGGGSSLKPAAQQLQSAALLTGADEPGVHDGGVVHRQHPGRAAVGLLVLDGPFIPGGEEEQQGGQRQAEHDGDVIAALGGVT